MASKSAAPSMQRMSVPKGGLGLGGLLPKAKATPKASPERLESASRIAAAVNRRASNRAKIMGSEFVQLNPKAKLSPDEKLSLDGKPVLVRVGGAALTRTPLVKWDLTPLDERKLSQIRPVSGLRTPALVGKFLYQMNVLDRADLLTKIPAEACDTLYEEMGVTKEYLLSTLKMSAATLGRKARSAAPLSSDEAEKILGVICLIGQVESMVEESGNANGFDAAKWFAEWIKSPNAALGGRRADELLSFGDGRQLLSGLLSQMQAGTYA